MKIKIEIEIVQTKIQIEIKEFKFDFWNRKKKSERVHPIRARFGSGFSPLEKWDRVHFLFELSIGSALNKLIDNNSTVQYVVLFYNIANQFFIIFFIN